MCGRETPPSADFGSSIVQVWDKLGERREITGTHHRWQYAYNRTPGTLCR